MCEHYEYLLCDQFKGVFDARRDTLREMTRSQTQDQICILWHPAGHPSSAALIGALSRRGLSVTLASSAHRVFASACSAQGFAKRVVIVLDKRDELTQVDRVIEGLERFGPGVLCWEHQEGANPPMIPIVRSVSKPVVSKQSTTTVLIGALQSRFTKAPSALRLVGDEPDSDEVPSPARAVPIQTPAKSPKTSGSISSRDVLDADELNALLAGEMGEGRRGK